MTCWRKKLSFKIVISELKIIKIVISLKKFKEKVFIELENGLHFDIKSISNDRLSKLTDWPTSMLLKSCILQNKDKSVASRTVFLEMMRDYGNPLEDVSSRLCQTIRVIDAVFSKRFTGNTADDRSN